MLKAKNKPFADRRRWLVLPGLALILLLGIIVWRYGSNAATKSADLNLDGTVNVFDLSILLNKWGATGTQAADINDDGIVNVFDLSLILARWGTSVPTPIPTPSPTPPANPVPLGVTGNWTLKFRDEFNGTSLDSSRWSSTAWGGQINKVTVSAANVAVTGGELILKLPSSSSGAAISSAPYHGAGSNGYALPPGSYAEAKVFFQKNSAGNCTNWPAWWTTGNQWPQDGEHDIAEVLGGRLTAGNYHSGLNGTDVPNNGPAPAGSWCGAYHTYGIYRKASSAEIYWDGTLMRSYPTADTGFAQALVLNIGLSGSYPSYPGELRVDYVRAWAPAP